MLKQTLIVLINAGAVVAGLVLPTSAATFAQYAYTRSIGNAKDFDLQYLEGFEALGLEGTLEKVMAYTTLTYSDQIRCSFREACLVGAFEVTLIGEGAYSAINASQRTETNLYIGPGFGNYLFTREPLEGEFELNPAYFSGEYIEWGHLNAGMNFYLTQGQARLQDRFPVIDGTLTLVYEYSEGDSTSVPEPGLVPGLIGIGVAALRKQQQQVSES